MAEAIAEIVTTGITLNLSVEEAEVIYRLLEHHVWTSEPTGNVRNYEICRDITNSLEFHEEIFFNREKPLDCKNNENVINLI